MVVEIVLHIESRSSRRGIDNLDEDLLGRHSERRRTGFRGWRMIVSEKGSEQGYIYGEVMR
jgi:hypothetical protein